MMENNDQSTNAVEKPSSLTDKMAMGGIIALGGFDFQRNYALILLIKSLEDPQLPLAVG